MILHRLKVEIKDNLTRLLFLKCWNSLKI